MLNFSLCTHYKCHVILFSFNVFFVLFHSATTTRREVFVWKFNPYGCISALIFDAAIYSVTYSEYISVCVCVYILYNV